MKQDEFDSIREALIKELDYTNSSNKTTEDAFIYKENSQYFPLLGLPKEEKDLIPFSIALQSIRGYSN